MGSEPSAAKKRPASGSIRRDPSPLISCIVPAHNAQRFLPAALESVLGQGYRPLEIVVVDDGSTDETRTVLKPYGDSIHYHFQQHGGPWQARNLGLEAAKGEYVAFLDADDLWHPEKLELQVQRFTELPGLDLSFTEIQNFWDPDCRAEEKRCQTRSQRLPMPGYSMVTLLARRSFFSAVGLFNTQLQHAAGLEWILRARARSAIIEVLPDVLVKRRLHRDNYSRRQSARSRKEYLMFLKALISQRRNDEAKLNIPRAEPSERAM